MQKWKSEKSPLEISLHDKLTHWAQCDCSVFPRSKLIEKKNEERKKNLKLVLGEKMSSSS